MRSKTATIKTVLAATAALLVLAMAGTAHDAIAQTEDPLKVILTLKKVEATGKGKETLVDAATVKPGDLVEYQAVYTNSSKEALAKVQATLPIPATMEYEGESARPTSVEASLDGKAYAAVPLKRTVTDKSGKKVQAPVPYAEYRSLRWLIPVLEPGKPFIAKARARVSQSNAAPAKTTAPAKK